MIARYASEGVRYSLYCATDGDAGRSSGIPVSSREALGRVYFVATASDSIVPASERSFCVMPPASWVDSVQRIFV